MKIIEQIDSIRILNLAQVSTRVETSCTCISSPLHEIHSFLSVEGQDTIRFDCDQSDSFPCLTHFYPVFNDAVLSDFRHYFSSGSDR